MIQIITIKVFERTKKEFTISYGEPLELTTPTMDYGKIFILSLIK